VPYMSVAENIWLGREPLNKFGLIDKKALVAKTKKLLEGLEININPSAIDEKPQYCQYSDG
jgi:ABC-type sugar transport system ATPase subunit